MRITRLLVVLALAVAACGGSTGDTTTTTAAAATTAATTTTTAAATTTTAAATTTTAAPAGDPLTETATGVYTIDWDGLQGAVFYAAPAAGSSDPFFHVHTDPATDGFFFSVEAYTTGYGTAWTGELGETTVGCTPAGSGICIHFDPDGPGPIGDLNADFMATGFVDVLQADADGFVGVFTDVSFSDGTTIPGPFTVSGGTVTG